GDLAKEYAARPARSGQFRKRLAVYVFAGHIDVDAFYRHRKEFGIVGLFRQRADQTYEYLAPASDCYDISCLDYGIASRVGNFISSSNTLHKEPLLGDQCLGLFNRLAG